MHEQKLNILSALALALTLIVQNLGITAVSINEAARELILLPALFYYAGMLCCALLLTHLIKPDGSRALVVWLTLPIYSMLMLLLSHPFLWPGHNFFQLVAITTLQPFLVACYSTMSLFLIFRLNPGAKIFLLLGLVVAAGEFVWLFVNAQLYPGIPHEVKYNLLALVQKVQISGIIGVGLILSALFYKSAALPSSREKDVSISYEAVSKPARKALGWLFIATVTFYALYGTLALEIFPKANVYFTFSENKHILLIFFAPILGELMDKNRKPLPYLLIFMAIAVLISSFMTLASGFLYDCLQTLLYLIRNGLFLLTLLFTYCLAGRSRFFILWYSLFYVCQSAAFIGYSVETHLLHAIAPTTALPATLLLSAVFIFMLARFWLQARGVIKNKTNELSILARNSQERSALSEDSAPHEAEKELDPLLNDKLRFNDFADSYHLSVRERIVLKGVLRQTSLQDIGEELGLTESSAKYHLRLLLNKTNTINRRGLLHFYRNWTPNKTAGSQIVGQPR